MWKMVATIYEDMVTLVTCCDSRNCWPVVNRSVYLFSLSLNTSLTHLSLKVVGSFFWGEHFVLFRGEIILQQCSLFSNTLTTFAPGSFPVQPLSDLLAAALEQLGLRASLASLTFRPPMPICISTELTLSWHNLIYIEHWHQFMWAPQFLIEFHNLSDRKGEWSTFRSHGLDMCARLYSHIQCKHVQLVFAPQSVIYLGWFVQYAPLGFWCIPQYVVHPWPIWPSVIRDIIQIKLQRDPRGVELAIVRSQWIALQVPKISLSLCLSSLFLIVSITAGRGNQPGIQGQSLGLCQWGEAKHKHTRMYLSECGP